MKSFLTRQAEAIEAFVPTCSYCVVSLVTPQGEPYGFPMNFVWHQGSIYLHGAPEGLKMEALAHSRQVSLCFTQAQELVYQHAQVACSHSMRGASVIARGEVTFLETLEQKEEAFEEMMHFYTGRRGFNYSQPSLEHVVFWKVSLEQATLKWVGLSYAEYQELQSRWEELSLS